MVLKGHMFHRSASYRAPYCSLPLDQPFEDFLRASTIQVRRVRNIAKYWAARTFQASPASDKWVSFAPIPVRLADGSRIDITPVWRNAGSEESPQFVLHSVHRGGKGTQTDDWDCGRKWSFPVTAFDVDVVEVSTLRLILPSTDGEGSSEEPEPR